MMQRILNSRNLVAFVLAAATGMTLYFLVLFPNGNIFLQVMALRSPSAFEVLKYSYTLILFSTAYIAYSVALSGLYIFAPKAKRRMQAGKLPLFLDPRKTDDLFLVVREVHNPRKQVPAESPQWLVIPERGLFTGVAILGAIGSGKTSCCMYPFAEQILAYRSDDTEKRIGGLVLEVKGDFCNRVNEILARHGRTEDYVEISLDSQYRYNPLQSDQDAHALAYNIASLLNNLFGCGKELTQTYHLRDFKLQIDSQDAPRHHEELARKKSASTSTLSQSEHDWAYPKRALARGDDPEEVFRGITDYRGDQKLANYARKLSKKHNGNYRGHRLFNIRKKLIPLPRTKQIASTEKRRRYRIKF